MLPESMVSLILLLNKNLAIFLIYRDYNLIEIE